MNDLFWFGEELTPIRLIEYLCEAGSWDRKAEKSEPELDTISVHVHDRIDPSQSQ